MEQYKKINKKMLKGNLLIESRNTYLELVSKEFLINKIIPIEYIDNRINLDNINKHILDKNYIVSEINDTQRLKFINELLSKECIKGTARIISDMCSI
jgi:hypothetical protein